MNQFRFSLSHEMCEQLISIYEEYRKRNMHPDIYMHTLTSHIASIIVMQEEPDESFDDFLEALRHAVDEGVAILKKRKPTL